MNILTGQWLSPDIFESQRWTPMREELQGKVYKSVIFKNCLPMKTLTCFWVFKAMFSTKMIDCSINPQQLSLPFTIITDSYYTSFLKLRILAVLQQWTVTMFCFVLKRIVYVYDWLTLWHDSLDFMDYISDLLQWLISFSDQLLRKLHMILNLECTKRIQWSILFHIVIWTSPWTS